MIANNFNIFNNPLIVPVAIIVLFASYSFIVNSILLLISVLYLRFLSCIIVSRHLPILEIKEM